MRVENKEMVWEEGREKLCVHCHDTTEHVSQGFHTIPIRGFSKDGTVHTDVHIVGISYYFLNEWRRKCVCIKTNSVVPKDVSRQVQGCGSVVVP